MKRPERNWDNKTLVQRRLRVLNTSSAGIDRLIQSTAHDAPLSPARLLQHSAAAAIRINDKIDPGGFSLMILRLFASCSASFRFYVSILFLFCFYEYYFILLPVSLTLQFLLAKPLTQKVLPMRSTVSLL